MSLKSQRRSAEQASSSGSEILNAFSIYRSFARHVRTRRGGIWLDCLSANFKLGRGPSGMPPLDMNSQHPDFSGLLPAFRERYPEFGGTRYLLSVLRNVFVFYSLLPFFFTFRCVCSPAKRDWLLRDRHGKETGFCLIMLITRGSGPPAAPFCCGGVEFN